MQNLKSKEQNGELINVIEFLCFTISFTCSQEIVVLFLLGDIHPCMFFIMFFVFCILRVKADKFRFKDLFEQSFLRSEEEINKYTEWRQKENHEDADDLESERMRPVCNISHYPDNETKPYNKEINYNCTKEDIWIEPGHEIEREVHKFDYR